MKLSELKKYIEENIVEILGEELSSAEINSKKSEIALAQEKVKDATSKLQTAKTPLEKKAAQDALVLAKEKLTQANALKEAKDEDEEVEDTYGKEDEDDKKDAKIKAAKPSKSDLKKNASIATITDALAKVTIEFKEITEKYKKAEGGEKAKFLAKLKDLTPKIQTLKKALEKKEEALK